MGRCGREWGGGGGREREGEREREREREKKLHVPKENTRVLPPVVPCLEEPQAAHVQWIGTAVNTACDSLGSSGIQI